MNTLYKHKGETMAVGKTKQRSQLDKVWATLRILIGLILIWAFLDKLIGLGFATCRTVDPVNKTETVTVMCEKAWLNVGSPTEGFLSFATKGPLQDTYSSLAGNTIVDVLFMAGLLLIGLSLLTGIGVKVASVSGILLFMMMWSAVLPGENNPILDDHIVYSVVLLGILMANKTQVWGCGQWWQKQAIVKKYPILA